MSDHRVLSLKAAVELAERWCAAGTHAWFRGQNRLWPISTSLARRLGNPEEVARIQDRIAQFCNWLDDVPELRHLLQEEHVHALFAILQHYGVPTHYVDFTINPRVAGFFAGVGPDASTGEEGCIIAIDPDAWVGVLRSIAEVKHWPVEAWPEQVVVNVPNLWRLEAQSGHFVYLPIEKAEAYLPVDRIIFTHDGNGFEMTEEEVYPSRKSPLEERLDEFFTEELMRGNQEYLRAMARTWSTQGQGAWVTYERPVSSRWLRAGKGGHESWRRVPPAWSAYVHETYHETRDGTTATLSVDAQEPLRQRDALRASVLRLLAQHPGVRRKVIDWKIVSVSPGTPRGWIEFVERAAGRTWDSVRRLPFTDDQVAEALAMTVVLACDQVCETPLYSMRDFSALLGPSIPIELANAREVTARATMA